MKNIDSIPLIKQSPSKKKWVHTEERYEDSLGRVIRVYNSYPRGGAYNSSGQIDGYRIFWTSIVNESTTPLKLTVEFPIDSFPTVTSPDAFIKALIPPDTMTLEKLELFDFGVTNIKSILDNGFKKPSQLEITLKPREEYYYNTIFLFHESEGTARSALVLKGKNLFYRINIDSQPSLIIPCGRIEFIN
ncbi:hypothetical protein KJS94_02815 [Flavihumibacter rivuli]|uniref:hypothetical protein n=1 Tax=Flavihumibacter rivuli TaxID=2838156 RepID=UPI001BDE35FC|nr:hypothetical protein [Flavihumibacter rivuli]ULQ57128.1 hypothetical protein KJS94_02815 [Flavihumibacter rivuli]